MLRTRLVRPSAALLVMGACICGSTLTGQTTLWTGTESALLNDVGNWSNGLPTVGGTARFSNNYTANTLFLDADFTVGTWSFRNTNLGETFINVDLSGFTLAAATELHLGSESTSNNLRITGGTLNLARLRIGYVADTKNVLELSGSSLGAVTGEVRLGHAAGSGDNTLRLVNGASASTGGSTNVYVGYESNTKGNRFELSGGSTFTANNLIVVGNAAGSSENVVRVDGGSGLTANGDIRVGSNGAENEFIVSGGSSVTANSNVFSGYANSSSGNLIRVTGTGSSINAGGNLLTVGSSGSGGNNRIEVLAGGVIHAGDTRIGQADGVADDAILVDGENSRLNIASLRVGIYGNQANLTVSNGGEVQIRADGAGLLIGTQSGKTGSEVVVSSGASLVIEGGNVHVGDGASGTLLRVEDGGSVSVQGSGNFRVSSGGADNRIEVDGGSLVAAADRELSLVRGELNLSNGGSVEIPSIVIGSNGILSGSGNVKGDISAVNSSGGSQVVLGGDTFGKLSVEGNWANEFIETSIKLGDLTGVVQPGVEYDFLEILGIFTHGGVILIDANDLISTEAIENLQVLSWLNYSGDSANTTVTFLNNDFDLGYEWGADGLYINTIPEPAAFVWIVALSAAGLVLLRRKR